MGKELISRDFFKSIPSLFDSSDEWFKFPRLSKEFEKIMNGKCDFEEDDERYKVELEVPGVKKDEISIDLKDDLLTVSWSRKREQKKKLGKSHYERSEGSFTRSFRVEGAAIDKVKAELKHGVLSIEIPKNEECKPRRIEIK